VCFALRFLSADCHGRRPSHALCKSGLRVAARPLGYIDARFCLVLFNLMIQSPLCCLPPHSPFPFLLGSDETFFFPRPGDFPLKLGARSRDVFFFLVILPAPLPFPPALFRFCFSTGRIFWVFWRWRLVFFDPIFCSKDRLLSSFFFFGGVFGNTTQLAFVSKQVLLHPPFLGVFLFFYVL